ncbi:hypothetical protein GCM10022207_47470 [Streptomyces lannensis]|uniref:Uncharacterized protein n=1 Tax=Streptomyces lannensis TaxID=766498 RepID=A0ABP7KFZ8_9ACTN
MPDCSAQLIHSGRPARKLWTDSAKSISPTRITSNAETDQLHPVIISGHSTGWTSSKPVLLSLPVT